jgi:hypothetical protein
VTGLVRAQAPTALESYDNPGYFLATTTSAGPVQLIKGANTTAAGQWYLVPGLANATAYSFQSVALADHFMRHRSFVLYADPRATDSLYQNDASFRQVPGLADPTAVSFQSVNYTDRYIMHNAALAMDSVKSCV